MTDRAEPGVTPLTAVIHAYFEDNVQGGCVHFDKGFGPYAACEDPDNLVPIRAVQGLLDAATPRPGLVEALREQRPYAAYSKSRTHGIHVDKEPDCREYVVGECFIDATLASGTGEPELDYETWVGRVADAIHETCRLEWQAIAVVDPKRQVTQHMADAHYGMAHDLVRRLRLANDKGADPEDAEAEARFLKPIGKGT
jgi:hypothetical protein